MNGSAVAPVDADFSHQVLTELYRYRPRRLGVAWLLWGTLGWLGAHRLYLGRDASALLMVFTVGGLLVWWVVDAFHLRSDVDAYNAEQSRRREAGLPPLELAFMPPLDRSALQQPPAWLRRWQARGRLRQRLRFAGDVVVLVVAGIVLGRMVTWDGSEEAIFAIAVLVGLTALGGTTAGLERVPIVRGLLAWNHRLRLFYYFNAPRSPPALLLRPIVGLLLAPYRARERAEVLLYIKLGLFFVIGFLLLDLVQHVFAPLARGEPALGVVALLEVLMKEAVVTFFITYAFAAPIGAVLTLQLLTRPTHTVPRALSGMTLMAILVGVSLAP
jgi:hypothetical protein